MSGISSTTITDLMLAAGAYVTVGGVDMGALSGVIHFWIEIEREHPELWGIQGEMKGTGRIRRASPKLAFDMMEWEYTKFQQVWHGLGHSSDANSETIGGGIHRKLHETDDYKQIVILGMELCDGYDVKIILDQAYVSNNPDVTLSDRENSVIGIEMTGVYLPEAPTTFPATIYIQRPVTAGWYGTLLAIQSGPL